MEATTTCMKRAVRYEPNKTPYLICTCGETVSLPQVAGLPLTFVCGHCGTEYDHRGWIQAEPEDEFERRTR